MIRLGPGRATAGHVEVSRLREGFDRPVGAGKVIYKSDHNTLGRFPEPKIIRFIVVVRALIQIGKPEHQRQDQTEAERCSQPSSDLAGRPYTSISTRSFRTLSVLPIV